MLTPDLVRPFTRHESAIVRDHAFRYFERSGDLAPVSADDVFFALDRHGAPGSLRALSLLPRASWTATGLRRLMELARAPQEQLLSWHVARAIAALPLVDVASLLDVPAVLKMLPDELVKHLADRVALAELPLDDAWARLEKHAAALAAGVPDSLLSELATRRVVEATARHAGPAADRALAALERPDGAGYMGVLATQVLGALREPRALPALLRVLEAEESELVAMEATRALGRLGTADVVAALDAAAIKAEPDSQVWLHGLAALGMIKLPASEALAARRLAGTSVEHEGARLTLALSLVELGTHDHLPAVLAVADAAGEDDLAEEAYACAVMTGHALAGDEALRTRALAHREAEQRRAEQLARAVEPKKVGRGWVSSSKKNKKKKRA